MAGERDLDKLLASLSPRLMDDDFVFCTIKGATYGDFADLSPLASFSEDEGLTLVLTKENADKAGFPHESLFKCITLDVHSSLEAVGLTAAVSRRLADRGISANIIAAYHHDHVFVQAEKADDAREALGAGIEGAMDSRDAELKSAVPGCK
jgi:uncharacterized protein